MHAAAIRTPRANCPFSQSMFKAGDLEENRLTFGLLFVSVGKKIYHMGTKERPFCLKNKLFQFPAYFMQGKEPN